MDLQLAGVLAVGTGSGMASMEDMTVGKSAEVAGMHAIDSWWVRHHCCVARHSDQEQQVVGQDRPSQGQHRLSSVPLRPLVTISR